MSSDYLVRLVRAEDADELGQVHVQVWREAYAGLMAAEHLAALRWERSAERFHQVAALGAVEPPRCFRVAEHRPSGALVGMISVGSGRDDDAPTPVELAALNVLAAHHGTGVATQLVDAALGEQAAYLWVVDGNKRAQAFYRKHGFAPDGGTKRDERLGVNELRMVRD